MTKQKTNLSAQMDDDLAEPDVCFYSASPDGTITDLDGIVPKEELNRGSAYAEIVRAARSAGV